MVECFRHALVVGVLIRGMLGVVAHLRPCANALLRPGRKFNSCLHGHIVVASVLFSFENDVRLTHTTTSWIKFRSA